MIFGGMVFGGMIFGGMIFGGMIFWWNDLSCYHPFNFTCDQDNFEYLTRIVSEYRKYEHDRGFKFMCRKGFVSRDCHWANGSYDGFLNDWDKNLTFNCPDNHIITGIKSEHDNHKEDRRWNFKCCMVRLSQ